MMRIIEQRFHTHCAHCGAEMPIEMDKTIDIDDSDFHWLVTPCECLGQDRIAELEAVAIEAWQAGFSRGHDDTVEGCFNPGYADDPEAAQEWLDEWNRQKWEQT